MNTTITAAGDQFEVRSARLAGALKHYHYDIFQLTEATAGFEGLKLTFLMNRAGEIDRVTIPIEPTVKEIVFTRKSKPLEQKSTLE